MISSLLPKPLSLWLVIAIFANSIGHAAAATPDLTPPCGEWRAALAYNDQRVGIQLAQSATGSDCHAIFKLQNRTGTFLGGGYTLELTTSLENATVRYLPHGDPFLIPELDVTEIETKPIDITKRATINLQGQVTLGSFLAVDLSFFALKSALDLIPLPTGCLISYDQLLLLSLRTASLMEDPARRLQEGQQNATVNEFSKVVKAVFFERAGDIARDVGISCVADFFQSILKKPLAIAKIILEYSVWVPVTLFDYYQYQGLASSIVITYIPPVATRPSPAPSTQAPVLPDGYWTGPVKHAGSPDYTMNLTLAGCTAPNMTCGSIEFPELSCGGTVIFLVFDNGKFLLRPTIEQGQGNCLDYWELKGFSYFEIELVRLEGDSWEARFVLPAPQEGVIAWAKLTRLDSPSGTVMTPSPLEGSCPSAPTRIKVGDTAAVIQSTFLYSRPDLLQQSIIDNSYVDSNETVLITGGPVCGAQQRWYSVNHNGQAGLIPEVGPAGVYRYAAGLPGFWGCVGLSLRQLFGMRLDGQDYLVLRGTRHLIPNDDTKKALGASASGNPWNLSQSEMRQYKKGQDVPDVDTDPIGFANFRDQLYPCFSEAALPP